MKKIINFLKKELFILKEEDKLYMLPWEMMKWIVSKPTAWQYKGMREFHMINAGIGNR